MTETAQKEAEELQTGKDGEGTFVVIRGRRYYLSPLEKEDLEEYEREFARQKVDPLDAVMKQERRLLEMGRKDLFDAMLDRAYREITAPAGVRSSDVAAWMDTTAGTEFFWFLTVRKRHPDFKREDAAFVLACLSAPAQARLREHFGFAESLKTPEKAEAGAD